jgi:hypothetical protein
MVSSARVPTASVIDVGMDHSSRPSGSQNQRPMWAPYAFLGAVAWLPIVHEVHSRHGEQYIVFLSAYSALTPSAMRIPHEWHVSRYGPKPGEPVARRNAPRICLATIAGGLARCGDGSSGGFGGLLIGMAFVGLCPEAASRQCARAPGRSLRIIVLSNHQRRVGQPATTMRADCLGPNRVECAGRLRRR